MPDTQATESTISEREIRQKVLHNLQPHYAIDLLELSRLRSRLHGSRDASSDEYRDLRTFNGMAISRLGRSSRNKLIRLVLSYFDFTDPQSFETKLTDQLL